MNIEVLVSTMNITNYEDYNKLLKNMNINGNSLVINQCPNEKELLKDITNNTNKLYSYKEKGLSRSRNKAINLSTSDICVIADDDLKYKKNYKNIIKKAYKKYPDADIIAFYVNSLNKDRPTTKQKEGKLGILRTFKVYSYQITFKRRSIINSNIEFETIFGAGSNVFMSGEENIFLTDCIKKGLKIYYVNETIADVYQNDTTWYRGFTKEYFKTIGACYYRISKVFWFPLCMQYIIRKYTKYSKETSIKDAIKSVFTGKKEYKSLKCKSTIND